MEDSEGPFQAGAVDEVLRRAPANRYRNDADEYAAQGRHTQTETEDETEDSPLIAKVPSVGVESHHTTDSTPWIETAEYKNLPWSRRPSVSYRVLMLDLTNMSGLLAPPGVPSILLSLWRPPRTANIPHPRSDVPRVLVRPIS